MTDHFNQSNNTTYGSTDTKKYFKGKTEDIIEGSIGNFGKWQCRISLLMSLLKFPIAWFQLGIVFLAPPTEFWCKPPDERQDIPLDEWLDLIKPPTNFSEQEGLVKGSCLMTDRSGNKSEIVNCRWGYEYNRSVVHSSIITEWDMVCGRERLIELTQIIFMLGVLIGNIFCGVISDKFGRKFTLVVCIIAQSFCGILSAWAPSIWGFLFFRFFLAIANGGTMIVSFVMCMEVVGGKWRTIIPILYQIPFGIGNSLMSGLAFCLRDWRELQFTLSMLSSFYIVYLWSVPESPRWLMAVGRKNEMIEVLENAAVCNGLDPSVIKNKLSEYNFQEHKENHNVSALFRTPQLRTRTILMCFNWLICGITFYAFSQYLGQVSHNIYLTVALGGLIAIPGTIFCVFVVDKFGRRLTISCAHLLTAACFFSILVIPRGVFKEDWPRIGFAGLGIIGMSISMPALYLFTGELYPTIVRNAGVGFCIMFSRIGSMIAPLVIALHDVFPFLPLLLLGILAIIESILVLPLPETKGTNLIETINDMKNNNKAIHLKVLDKGKYASVPNKPPLEDVNLEE